MNQNLSLRQLRAFDAVAAEGSFTKAAQRLFLTQSALSVLIRELERELGVAMFNRSTRRVELTEAGRDMQPYVHRVLNELAQGVSSVMDLRDKKKGVLRVAAPQLMACTLVPVVLAAFQQRYPGVEIQLQDVLQEHLLARAQAGDVEIAIGPDGDLDEAGLSRRPILRDHHWLVCRPDDPIGQGAPPRWLDLGRCQFVAPTRDFKQRLRSVLGVYAEPLLLQPGWETSYFTTAFGMVASGLGVTMCPTYASSLVRSYGLKMVAMQEPAFHREVCVYSRSARAPSPAASAFLQCLKEVVSSGEFGIALLDDEADG